MHALLRKAAAPLAPAAPTGCFLLTPLPCFLFPSPCSQARAPPPELICSHPDASLVNAAAQRAQQLSQAGPAERLPLFAACALCPAVLRRGARQPAPVAPHSRPSVPAAQLSPLRLSLRHAAGFHTCLPCLMP